MTNGGKEEDLPRLLGEIERVADAFAGGRSELDERRVTGTDGAGWVVATVSGSAQLLQVRIDPRAMRDLDHVALSQALLDAIGAARESAAEGLREILDRLNGGRPQPAQEDDPSTLHLDAILREGGLG
ncbi:YbaB/EbfC family nucleoid-associated protein [Nonomuraea roseoviolacea]|uniref:DNA-binding protein YbaB n=1 Tax=Nonomuraea roseoviolacea subsp. carminata TaxID=160689 RepID=A0ABT1K1C9_9ACTN|nr:YbaB/EbfC family nucleoid-associated protein [Nonomuraea roseoviolacea]MCP2347804.1 DNA-binding protein YbaB [Nonomuraea roseoviolacea subsp. carminata]